MRTERRRPAPKTTLALGVLPMLAGLTMFVPSAHRVARNDQWIPRVIATTIGTVDLEWPAAPGGADSYQILRNGVAVATVEATATSYTDTAVTASGRYTYSVVAVGGAGDRSAQVKIRTPRRPDLTDTTPPTAPEDAYAISQPDGSIVLDWQYGHDDSDVSGYVIYRDGVEWTTVDSGTLRFTDPEPTAGATYELQTLDVVGNESARQPATPMIATAPSAPTTGNLRSATRAIAARPAAFAANAALRRYPYLTDVVNNAANTRRLRHGQLGDRPVGHRPDPSSTGRSRATGRATPTSPSARPAPRSR